MIELSCLRDTMCKADNSSTSRQRIPATIGLGKNSATSYLMTVHLSFSLLSRFPKKIDQIPIVAITNTAIEIELETDDKYKKDIFLGVMSV